MTEVEKRKEKLKIEEVGDKLTVAKWKLETCALEQDKLEQATRALEVEVAAAKNANQKAALLVSLEDKVASATRARQKLMLINHVDMGDTDEFGLLDAWPSVPAIATAANGLDEKLQARLERMAEALVSTLFTFLCKSVLAMEPEDVRRKAAQERLEEVLRTPIVRAAPERMRASTALVVRSHAELYGKDSVGMLPSVLQTLLPQEVWAAMPGKSVLEAEAKKVRDAQGEDPKKAALAKLEETLATAVADAAHKLPPPTTQEKKGKPTAPAVSKTPQVLPADSSEPLWDGYEGCRKCGSELHKAQDHGGGGGKNRGKPKKMFCKVCGRDNHWTQNCRDAKCQKCGGDHWAADCKESPEAKPGSSAQKKEPKENKTSDGDKYSVVAVKGLVDGQEATVGIDTFCSPESLVAESMVKGKPLTESSLTLEGVGADVEPRGATRIHVELAGGAEFDVNAEVLPNLPGGVDVLIGDGPLEEQGLTVKAGKVFIGGRECERVFVAATAEKENRAEDGTQIMAKGKAASMEATAASADADKRERKRLNRALSHLEQNEKGFLELRRQGLVVDIEAGTDGKAYAHVIGQTQGVRTHGDFYASKKDEEEKKKPRAKRYRGGPLPRVKCASTLGDIEVSAEQEARWEQQQREALEAVNEKKKAQATEEADAWADTIKQIQEKENGTAGSDDSEEKDDAVHEELENKLWELGKAREVAAAIKTGKFRQVAAPVVAERLCGKGSRLELEARVQEAVDAAVSGREQQWVELGAEELRTFLAQCTKNMDTRPAAPSVPKTVRAVEAVAGGEWEKATSGDVFGGDDDMEVAGVDLDEFCFPEPTQQLSTEEFQKRIDDLLRKSKLQTEKAKQRYKQIMLAHKDAFCEGLKDFKAGQVDAAKLKLDVTEGPPIRQARRPLPPDKRDWLAKITVEYDKAGIWEPPSPEMWNELWISNPVIPEQLDKQTGERKFRLTVDYAGPNSRITPYPGHTPVCEELATLLQGAVLIDKDDGISGYFQVALHPESKPITGVYTPLGVRVFNVMPLGINVAPTKWNELMANKFGDLEGTFTLMDDVLRFTKEVPGETREETEQRHLNLLEKFLDRVVAAKLRLKLPKAVHAVEELEALGMIYNGDTMRKTEWTYQVLRDYPAPNGPKKMQRFLALGQYYSRYTEGYAKLVAPLRVLEKKRRWAKEDMKEGSQERELFETIKARLTEDVRLALPDWNRPFVLKSDFSNTAMGAALLQEDANGKLRPIAYVSRKCVGSETTASAPDGELLALVWAVQRFEKFLAGRRFKAYVDQESLHWLHDKELCSINNKRLQAAFAYLRQFRFDLFYRKSKQMQDVDALTRIAAAVLCEGEKTLQWETWLEGEMEVAAPAARKKKKKTKKQVAEAGDDENDPGVAQVDLEGVWGFDTKLFDVDSLQAEDDEVKLVRAVRNGADYTKLEAVPAAFAAVNDYKSRDPTCSDFVEGEDGRLYHLEMINQEMVRQLYVPLEMRGRLVVTKHGSAAGGHRGAQETLAKLRKHYFWPSMSGDVTGWIQGCGCMQKKGERKQRVGKLSGIKLARPGEKIIFDFMKLPTSLRGNKYLLVIVDVGSREIALEAMPTREASGVAQAIMNRVYLRGKAPRVWQSDNAQEFVAKVMKELAALMGAKFKHSSPYHPQTNTHVERYNKTIATHLSLLVEREDQRDWDEHLRYVEYANLVGAQAVLGKISPNFLNGGWDAMDPLDRVMQSAKEKPQQIELSQWMTRLAKARTLAMQSQKLAGAESRKRRDVGAKNLDVDVGDKVWVLFPNVKVGTSQKLAFRLHGTYVLREWLHGEKRVALLAHEQDENDVVMAHVDRIVKKKEVPKKLRDLWKPIRMELVKDADEIKVGTKKEAGREKQGKLEVAPPGEEDVFHEDGAFRIEKILDHSTDEDGLVQFKVRFVGFGPKDDLWYDEAELVKWSPELVEEYKEKAGKKLASLGKAPGQKKAVPKGRSTVNTSATKAGEQKKQTQKGGNAEKKKAAT
jgi:hypothetical protein